MLINGKLPMLGKAQARKDPRNLKLAKYLPKVGWYPPGPVEPLVEVSWITKLAAAEALPMYLNDELGDCVAAAAGHMEQQWNFYAGHPKQPTDADVLASYEAVGGYAPGNPSTDNGMDMSAYLSWWKSKGLGGDEILAYLEVDFRNMQEMMQAVDLFGSVYLGIQLPTSAQGETAWTVTDGGIYTLAGAVGSWGGHCIPVVAVSPETLTCITWGTTLKMSHNFLADYADEAFAVLSSDWLNANGVSPEDLNITQLQADLAAL